MKTIFMCLIALAAVALENPNPENTCIAEPCLMWEMSSHQISKVVLGIFQGLGSFNRPFVLPYRVKPFFFFLSFN